MNTPGDFSVLWDAPVVPGVSLAGIPLLASYSDVEMAISTYLVDAELMLYRFSRGPELRLQSRVLDGHGNGGWLFALPHDDGSGRTAALSISIRCWTVRSIKVYALGLPGDVIQSHSYRGATAESIGLGDLVSSFLGFTRLDFDEAEEWFYTDDAYGSLEISGWGVPLEDEPEQIVTAMCVTA